MKKLFFIIIIILAIGCNSSVSIQKTINLSEFNESEKQDLLKLISFFESKILIEGKSKEDSYKHFFREFNKEKQLLFKKIPIKEQREFINKIDSSTINEIWYETSGNVYVTSDGKKLDTPIKYNPICVRIDGKYSRLLETIASNNQKVKYYLNSMKDSGDFPNFYTLFNLMVDTNGNFVENLNDGHWRIITSIHVLSINESEERYKSVTQD